MSRAVVFAYHRIGVRCLQVLRDQGMEIPLVLTHRDDPRENIWFESVARWCAQQGIPTITPDNPNHPAIEAALRQCQPELFFSFYYRHLLASDLLAIPRVGAYNLHGSLLPKYRGRVPVNWAVIHGESETGATLHSMTARPDQGAIVAQTRVPIGPDDTAFEVFEQIAQAGPEMLAQVLPHLIRGTAPHTPQPASGSSYFGGRRPEDGLINWNASAQVIHNLVRGVAPPYPGAFTHLDGQRIRVLRTSLASHPQAVACVHAGDGAPLYLLSVELDGLALSAAELEARFPTGLGAALRSQEPQDSQRGISP